MEEMYHKEVLVNGQTYHLSGPITPARPYSFVPTLWIKKEGQPEPVEYIYGVLDLPYALYHPHFNWELTLLNLFEDATLDAQPIRERLRTYQARLLAETGPLAIEFELSSSDILKEWESLAAFLSDLKSHPQLICAYLLSTGGKEVYILLTREGVLTDYVPLEQIQAIQALLKPYFMDRGREQLYEELVTDLNQGLIHLSLASLTNHTFGTRRAYFKAGEPLENIVEETIHQAAYTLLNGILTGTAIEMVLYSVVELVVYNSI